jgi:hypothetical protein
MTNGEAVYNFVSRLTRGKLHSLYTCSHGSVCPNWKERYVALKPLDMEVCYWALLFMPLVILHHLLNVSVQLANTRGLKKKTIKL